MSHALTVSAVCPQRWIAFLREVRKAWFDIVNLPHDWEWSVVRIQGGVAETLDVTADPQISIGEALYRIDFRGSESLVLLIGEGVVDATGTVTPGWHATIEMRAAAAAEAHILAAATAVGLARLCGAVIDDTSAVWVDVERLDPTAFVQRIAKKQPSDGMKDAVRSVALNMAICRRNLPAKGKR